MKKNSQDLDDVYSSTAFALKELLCRHTLDVDDNLNRAASSLALGSRGQLVFLNFLDLRGSSVACKKLINPEKDSFNLESKGSMKETPMTAALYEIGAQEVTLSMVLAMVYAESEVRGHMGLDDPMDKDNHVVGPASKGITWVEVKERKRRERKGEKENEKKRRGKKNRGDGSSPNTKSQKQKNNTRSFKPLGNGCPLCTTNRKRGSRRRRATLTRFSTVCSITQCTRSCPVSSSSTQGGAFAS